MSGGVPRSAPWPHGPGVRGHGVKRAQRHRTTLRGDQTARVHRGTRTRLRPAGTAHPLTRGGGVLGLTMTTHGDPPVPYTEIPDYAQLALGDGGGPRNQT